jgi:hypothetical protein
MLSYWTDQPIEPLAGVSSPSPTCLKGGWLAASDSGCIFTDNAEATASYAYTYCHDKLCQKTDGCFGNCPTTAPSGSTCAFDYDPSLKDTAFPYSCTPTYPNPLTFFQQYRLYLMIAAVVAVIMLLILAIIFVMAARSHR